MQKLISPPHILTGIKIIICNKPKILIIYLFRLPSIDGRKSSYINSYAAVSKFISHSIFQIEGLWSLSDIIFERMRGSLSMMLKKKIA